MRRRGRKRGRRKTMSFDEFRERRVEILEDFFSKSIKRLSGIEGVTFGEKNGTNRRIERRDELNLGVNVGEKRKTTSDQTIDSLIAMIDKANKELKETKVKGRIFSCLIKDRKGLRGFNTSHQTITSLIIDRDVLFSNNRRRGSGRSGRRRQRRGIGRRRSIN